jgi:AmiR/NasT family two-component response regulator|tara:strand:+ start:145 stop:303 length:159 start_codon:yes stop_codon:yes gene_type:complete
MTIKEIYAIVKEIEDHVEDTCCSVTMDPIDVKDLITKLRIAINEYDKRSSIK